MNKSSAAPTTTASLAAFSAATDALALPAIPAIGLEELQTFIVVARARSFSLAATQLHVTQPTVTGRIHRLEASLGVRLLHRTTRKVECTQDGELLLREAVKTLQGLAKVVDLFRKEARRARQRVVVAATPTIAALRLPPLIQSYALRYPDVEVELLDLQYAPALAAISDGRADLAVLALEPEDARYHFQPLWKDDMVLVAPRTHALARRKKVRPADLVDVPLIVVDQYRAVRARIAAALDKLGLKMPMAKVVGNLNTVLGMLDAGMGVTLLPRSVSTRGSVAAHACIEIADIDMTRTFGIVTAPGKHAGTALQSFIRYLRQANLQARE